MSRLALCQERVTYHRLAPSDFLDQHFVLMGFLCVGAVIGTYAASYFWHRSRGRFFTDPDPLHVIYVDSVASGYSMKSLWTMVSGGGAHLKLMLTSDTLWIRPFFPFLVVGPDIDLIHVIPLSCIEKVERRQRVFPCGFRISISFRLTDGSIREIRIATGRWREFETALMSAMESERILSPAADLRAGST